MGALNLNSFPSLFDENLWTNDLGQDSFLFSFLFFFFLNHVIEDLDGRAIIQLGNPGGGEQEHRRGGSHFCQESSYFSFSLAKFETPVRCLYVMLNMVT